MTRMAECLSSKKTELSYYSDWLSFPYFSFTPSSVNNDDQRFISALGLAICEEQSTG